VDTCPVPASDASNRSKARIGSGAYSITSSARASREEGIVRLSALAVLTLMRSSYSVGAWTGKSTGFFPFQNTGNVATRIDF
jgi:hypothetical protein